jgi:hypothetical protein
MTAVMRAVAASGPKVLRIGIVKAGRVVEERIVKQRGHVTVGPSEKSMFVVSAQYLPQGFRLFELVEKDYVLNWVDGMAGRVALPTGVTDLDGLRGHARRAPQGHYQVKLTEDSRGKLVIDDTTLLFQFVAPPPVQPRPQLPVAVTRGASSIDWPTTIIAAFSFLLHFMGIGALYSDWLDPVVDDELSVASLIDSVKALPPPPPVEQKADDTTDTAAQAAAAAKEEKAGAGQSKGPGAAKGSGKMSSAQAAALSRDLDQLEMGTIGALSSTGPATAGVLRSGEVPTGALDQAAASGAGVGVGSGELRIGTGGGGTIRPGEAGGGLGSIGTAGKAEGTAGAGKAQAVKGPRGSAAVGGANVSGGMVSNASAVVAGMRAGFRSCYQRSLQDNPGIEGRIQLSIRVGPGGEVIGVNAAPSGNLPGSVVECVKQRARSGQFDPPQGGAATIVVPVTFVAQ